MLDFSSILLENTHLPVAYDIELDLSTYRKKNFTSICRIKFDRNEQLSVSVSDEPLKVVLNSHNLIVLGATLGSLKGKVTKDQASQRVLIHFENLVSKDIESFEIEIKYIGQVNKINTFKEETRGLFATNYSYQGTDDDDILKNNTSDNYVFATQSQPCDSRRIFPCVDELCVKAKIKLSLKIAARFIAASSTPIVHDALLPENETVRLIKFKETEPMTISLFAFVCGDFEVMEKTIKLGTIFSKANVTDFPVRLYVLKGNLKKANYSLSFTSFVLRFITTKLKAKYPGEKLDLVALPFLSNGAVENWNLVSVQQDILLVDQEYENVSSNNPKIKQLNEIIVHELIHQWFGNLISFKSWNAYWLNESFATFLAYSILNELSFDASFINYENTDNCINVDYRQVWKDQQELLNKTFENDSKKNVDSISTITENVPNINATSISQTFNQLTYEKGIHLLRMFLNVFENENCDDSNDKFYDALSDLIDAFKFKTVDIKDYWLFLNSKYAKNNNIASEKNKNCFVDFVVSWIKLPGFPLVDVSITSEGLIKLVQHRFFADNEANLHEEEDYIYHIPLAITKKDGTTLHKFFNERSLVLSKEELSADDFVCLNTNRIGYYKVRYNSIEIFANIGKNLKTTFSSLPSFLLDYESFVGTKRYEQPIDGFLEILKFIKKKLNISYDSLEIIMRIVQYYTSMIHLYRSSEDYAHYTNNFLKPFTLRIFNLVKLWPSSFADVVYPKAEVKARNLIILTGVDIKEILKYASTMFKSLNHGPKESVPFEILSSILINYAYNVKEMKNFKKILNLSTRSSESLLINIKNVHNSMPVNVNDLQSAAISALGFVREKALFAKSLNYVATNFDSVGIELGLVGFNYMTIDSSYKKTIFEWFKLHVTNSNGGWGYRSLREGSGFSKQLYQTVHNMFEIICKNFTTEEDQKVLKNFVEKLSENEVLKRHDFSTSLRDIKDKQKIEKNSVENLDIRIFSV